MGARTQDARWRSALAASVHMVPVCYTDIQIVAAVGVGMIVVAVFAG